eukprot:1869615-Karenia_brevis.AAC.1
MTITMTLTSILMSGGVDDADDGDDDDHHHDDDDDEDDDDCLTSFCKSVEAFEACRVSRLSPKEIPWLCPHPREIEDIGAGMVLERPLQ